MSKTRQLLTPHKHADSGDLEASRWMRSYPRASEIVYDVPAEPQETTGLGDAMALLAQKKGRVILCALCGLAAGLGLAAIATPSYRARTSVQLEDFRDIPFVRTASISPGLPGSTVENYLQNQIKLIESETLATRVADSLGLQPEPPKPGSWSAFVAGLQARLNPAFGETESAGRRKVEAIERALTIRTAMQSQVIELYFDAPSPQMAADGANEVAAAFIDLNRTARTELISNSTAWLQDQADDLRARVEAGNQRLQDYARSAGLVFAGKDDTLAQDYMRQLQTALAQAETERAAKQSRYETVSKSGRLVSDAAQEIQSRQIDLENMRRELSELRTKFTPNHHDVIALEAKIAESERAIERTRDDIVARVQNDYTAAAGLEQMLADSQKRQLAVIERQMSQQRTYETMKSEVDSTQRLYETVLANLKEAGAASSLRSTNARVLDPASAPARPYSPNPTLNAAIGLGLGTLAGVGLVLLRGRSNKVAQPGQTVLFNVPELGVIPSSRHSWSGHPSSRLLPFRGKSEPGLVTWTHDASPMSESFRATLNSILFGAFMNTPGESGHGRVLTLSSFDPMAGKTTVVSNLAVASAERKLRVLVIDCDLRRPRVHSFFNLTNDRGLTDILSQPQAIEYIQSAPLESMVRSTHISNVSVLPSGPGSAAIPSLLYSTSMRALLQRFRSEFDLIFVDTPPIMLYSDARFLGRLSDGLVMVVRANTRSRDELRSVYARLMEDRVRVLGTILNGWEMDPHQSREFGAYYYRYQQPADRSA